MLSDMVGGEFLRDEGGLMWTGNAPFGRNGPFPSGRKRDKGGEGYIRMEALFRSPGRVIRRLEDDSSRLFLNFT